MGTTGYSFRSGLNQLRVCDYKVVQKEIMDALSIKSRAGWCARVAGRVIPRADEKERIDAIFAKYGVVKNIWI